MREYHLWKAACQSDPGRKLRGAKILNGTPSELGGKTRFQTTGIQDGFQLLQPTRKMDVTCL